MPELRVLRTTEELECLAPAWHTLWVSDSHATPFQHPAWLIPWWRQFSQPDLRAITISENGRLIAFLPLYVYREPHTGTRQLLLLGAGTSDYLDGIFSLGCDTRHVQQAVSLLQNDPCWHTAILTQLRESSPLFQALAPSATAISSEPCSRMPCLPIAELPRKIRQNVRYNGNRVSRLGNLELEVANESTCLSLFDTLVEMHSTRWQRRGQPGLLSDPRVLAWHRETIPALARHGLLHLSALRLNGEIIAVMYGLIDPPHRPNRTLYVYLPSFSQKYASFSPGSLLLSQAMEHAFPEGVRTVDLLRGDEPYKQLWHAQKSPTHGLVFSRTARADEPLVQAA